MQTLEQLSLGEMCNHTRPDTRCLIVAEERVSSMLLAGPNEQLQIQILQYEASFCVPFLVRVHSKDVGTEYFVWSTEWTKLTHSPTVSYSCVKSYVDTKMKSFMILGPPKLARILTGQCFRGQQTAPSDRWSRDKSAQALHSTQEQSSAIGTSTSSSPQSVVRS